MQRFTISTDDDAQTTIKLHVENCPYSSTLQRKGASPFPDKGVHGTPSIHVIIKGKGDDAHKLFAAARDGNISSDNPYIVCSEPKTSFSAGKTGACTIEVDIPCAEFGEQYGRNIPPFNICAEKALSIVLECANNLKKTIYSKVNTPHVDRVVTPATSPHVARQ